MKDVRDVGYGKQFAGQR